MQIANCRMNARRRPCRPRELWALVSERETWVGLRTSVDELGCAEIVQRPVGTAFFLIQLCRVLGNPGIFMSQICEDD